MRTYILCLFVLIIVCGCESQAHNEKSTNLDSLGFSVPPDNDKIDYVVLKSEDFEKELLANGKLSAVYRSNLKFKNDGIIESIFAKDGDYVQQGKLIAQLSDKQQQLNLHAALLSRQQAQLEYEDQLVRAGFKLNDSTKISSDIRRVARIRSGIDKTEIEVERAKIAVQNMKLIAPFSGKIADLKLKVFNNIGSFDSFCALVGDENLEVSFKILEQELEFIKKANNITISSFVLDNNFINKTKIKSINPLVDDKGMIEVKAILLEKKGYLMDGMNVNVKISQTLSNRIQVPKEAVVERQNRKVVFTLKNGYAQWNYVKIHGENEGYYLIGEGLNKGDTVIRKGAFNLAHEKMVNLK